MRYVSTRGGQGALNLDQALNAGLASDGGLFVPESLAPVTLRYSDSLPAVAAQVLAAFFVGSALAPELETICAEALDLPLPETPLRDENAALLELFHGPTAAFKDFAARFLAACLARLNPQQVPTTILVATSGDTGGAVAAAFHRRPGFRVVILYPSGRVSARQAHQLGAFGDNIHTYQVAGSFDDCQALVKSAFADQNLRSRVLITSANSISLGRLLPQMAYYAYVSLRWQNARSASVNLLIPTGNLGNALGAVLARRLGLPIGHIAMAANANHVLSDFFATGNYQPQQSLATLANAMDVGAPSNFERVVWLFPGRSARDADLSAQSVADAEIADMLRRAPDRYAVVVCPHTACALVRLERLRAAGDKRAWLVAATAHPAKFESIVEPLIGRALAVPAGLADLLQKPAYAITLENNYPALRSVLLS